MEKKYAVDRIESGIAILIADSDGACLHLPVAAFGFDPAEHDIVWLELDAAGGVISARRDDVERDARLADADTRLKRLFGREKS